MSRKTISIAAFIIILLGTTIAIALWKLARPNTDTTEPQASATTISTPAIPKTNPTHTDNGIKIAYPDADQAPERPTATPTYNHQDITQPTPNSELDKGNPEALAHEIITLYSSRTSQNDTTYQEQIRPHISDNLAQEIIGQPLAAFSPETYPIAVQEVHIGENITEWGVDTPVRYSHYATAKIATASNGNYIFDYRIAAMHNGENWVITDLAIDSWSAHHE